MISVDFESFLLHESNYAINGLEKYDAGFVHDRQWDRYYGFDYFKKNKRESVGNLMFYCDRFLKIKI